MKIRTTNNDHYKTTKPFRHVTLLMVLIGALYVCRTWPAVGGGLGPAAASGRRRGTAAGRAQGAGPPPVAQHHVAEDAARRADETAAEVPLFPVNPDHRLPDGTDDPNRHHRPEHTRRVLAAALPGVHVQQGHRLFLQTARWLLFNIINNF